MGAIPNAPGDVVWQDVINIAPGDAVAFSDPAGSPPAIPPVPGGRISVASQNAILALVGLLVDPCNFGTLTNYAMAYLAAHIAKVGLLRGTGPITSETVDRLTREYATLPQMNSIAYAGDSITSYGLMYLELLSRTGARFGAVP